MLVRLELPDAEHELQNFTDHVRRFSKSTNITFYSKLCITESSLTKRHLALFDDVHWTKKLKQFDGLGR